MHIPARCSAAFTISALLTLAVSTALGQAPGALPVPTDQTPATQPTDVMAATQPADTMPATDPSTEPSTAPAADATTTRPAITHISEHINPSTRVSFNFRDASVDAILDYLSESLGFIIIKDPGLRLDKRVTIISKQPVNAAEAIDLVNSILKPDYTAIQTERALRVVTVATAKKSNIPVRFGADPAAIPVNDELITQVIPLTSVDAVKLRADLAPMLNSDADIAANTGSNSIIVTDTSANIHRMVEIIAALDQHREAVSDIRTWQLKYANATNAAKLINDIFKADTTPTQAASPFGGFGGGGRRFGFGGGGGPGGQGAGNAAAANDTGGSTIAAKVNASSDDRTNTLVVVGPTATLKTIDAVVKQIDANPAEVGTFFIYNLKNGVATDLEPVLNTLFGNQTSGSSSSSRQSFSGSSFSNTSSSSSSGVGGSFGGSSGGRGGGGSSSSLGGFGGSSTSNRGGTSGTSSNGGSRPSVSSATAAVASELTGQVFVVANPDTNSLLITTTPALEPKVRKIIDELDRSVPQVLIKILIAEVTHTDNDDIGVELSALNTRLNGKGLTAGTDFGLSNVAAPTGGLVVGLVEDNVTATLLAIAGSNKLDVLSRPYILASDNQLASMIVGQEVPIVTNTQITDTGNTINSVSYQNVGIILDVTPHINPDGLVILDVTPQVSQLDTGNGVVIGPGATAPIIDIRAAQTRVGIKNGETIVIGGLMQDQKSQIVNKIPILGDIPYLGMLFKRTQNSKTKTELLIFLTPHVAQTADPLQKMSHDEEQGTKLTPNAVSPGTFEDHMRGLDRGSNTEPASMPPSPPANAPAYVPTTQPGNNH